MSSGIGRWGDSSDDDDDNDEEQVALHTSNVVLQQQSIDLLHSEELSHRQQFGTGVAEQVGENVVDLDDDNDADVDDEEEEEEEEEEEDEEERQRRIEEAKLAVAEKLMQQQSKDTRIKTSSKKIAVDDDLDDILNEFGIDTTSETNVNDAPTISCGNNTNPETTVDGSDVLTTSSTMAKRKKNKKKKNTGNVNGDEKVEESETNMPDDDTNEFVVDVTKLLKAKAASVTKSKSSKKLSVAAAVAVKEMQGTSTVSSTATTKKKKKFDKSIYER